MLKYINLFQSLTIKFVIVMMALVILSSTLEVAWTVFNYMLTAPFFFIGLDRLLDIFSLFFLIIIGIGLLETIKMIIVESSMNVDFIILVGVTAIIRRVMIIDLQNTDPLFLVGMGVLTVALAATYYLINSSEKEFKCTLNYDNEK
ncbi:phosphate-starvation-inducible PsiE family protein [Methanolobus sp. WCC5]|uniref:phosphate-starvation-inducible PsiE family protein n=1 Tax=Methanolobus sp. WCC5 TaxID=3125785 RepID=UPI00324AEBC6